MMESAMRCLIVERHDWETGAGQSQLQFVLRTAEGFFGPGGAVRRITLKFRWGSSLRTKRCSVSKVYRNGTRRLNGLPEMGAIAPGFVFFQETDDPDTYDMWWQADAAVVAARYHPWDQGQNSQYGRGRLSTIVDGPVPRPIDRV